LRTEQQLSGADAAFVRRAIEDFGDGDYLRVECVCGHSEMIPRVGVVGWRLPPYTRVLDLERPFRCRECDRKDSVSLSIKWAGG